jgi:hypothetical protein
MHSTLAKYALSLDTQSDIYAPKWRPQLTKLIRSLPDETRRCMEQELELLDLVQAQIQRLETRILERVRLTPTIQLIQSVPGPAEILSIVIERELGSIDRFRAAPRSAERVNGFSRAVPLDDAASIQEWAGSRGVVDRPISKGADPSSLPEVLQAHLIAVTAWPFWRNRYPSRRL